MLGHTKNRGSGTYLGRMTWLIILAVLASIIGTAYLHYRDQQTHTKEPQADAERDHRNALSELTVGGSVFTLLFAWLRKRRTR